MTDELRPVTRAEWIAALRSGDYSQGHLLLKATDGSYCCLGVACEIAGVKLETDTVKMQTADFYKVDAQALYKSLGLNGGINNFLAACNDGVGLYRKCFPAGHATFAEIATMIEEGWIERFVEASGRMYFRDDLAARFNPPVAEVKETEPTQVEPTKLPFNL